MSLQVSCVPVLLGLMRCQCFFSFSFSFSIWTDRNKLSFHCWEGQLHISHCKSSLLFLLFWFRLYLSSHLVYCSLILLQFLFFSVSILLSRSTDEPMWMRDVENKFVIFIVIIITIYVFLLFWFFLYAGLCVIPFRFGLKSLRSESNIYFEPFLSLSIFWLYTGARLIELT